MKSMDNKYKSGKTWLICFGLSIIGSLVFTTASFAASPALDCGAVVSTDRVELEWPSSTSPGSALAAVSVGFSAVNPGTSSTLNNGPHQWCYTLTVPDANDAVCEGPDPFIIPDNTQFYWHIVNTNVDTRCTYAVTLNSATTVHAASEVNLVRSSATAVPIFTPLGLIATLGGLLWFGRRRKAKVSVV
ncbi:MAG: hypothetical protein ACKE8R_09835 [Methylophagaceae bacterium]